MPDCQHNTRQQVEEEQLERGVSKAFEASLVEAGVPIMLCSQDSPTSIACGVYAEIRSLMDQVFPSDGVECTCGGWLPACGQGWWRQDCFWRESVLCRGYQDMCAASELEVPQRMNTLLNEHCAIATDAETAHKPLILIDDTDGTTASVLLAIWARQFALAHAGEKTVVYHRVGLVSGVPASTELAVIIAEIRRRFELNADLWEDANIGESLADWLKMAAQRSSLVLVIDGLELLGKDMSDVAGGLWRWIPESIPANCKIVLAVGDVRDTAFQGMRYACVPHTLPFVFSIEILSTVSADSGTLQVRGQTPHRLTLERFKCLRISYKRNVPSNDRVDLHVSVGPMRPSFSRRVRMDTSVNMDIYTMMLDLICSLDFSSGFYVWGFLRCCIKLGISTVQVKLRLFCRACKKTGKEPSDKNTYIHTYIHTYKLKCTHPRIHACVLVCMHA
jgi:hypothetical protein